MPYLECVGGPKDGEMLPVSPAPEGAYCQIALLLDQPFSLNCRCTDLPPTARVRVGLYRVGRLVKIHEGIVVDECRVLQWQGEL